MPNKERLPLFVTKLVSAQWESGAIKIEFNAGSEEVHTRFLSRPYAKELALALLKLLADKDTEPSPPFDDLTLQEEGELIGFKLKKEGIVVLTGHFTKSVGERAQRWLTKLFDGPSVVRTDKWSRKKV